jgi:hypothetical protein
MIGEAAFHPLKRREKRPESSKQAEMRLAWIVTILATGQGGQIPDETSGSARQRAAPVRVELPAISAGYG